VRFDHFLGESFYNDRLGPLVDDLIAKSIARESDGAICVFSDGSVPPEEDPFMSHRDGEWEPYPCMVRKGDGGFLYSTTDLATIDFRLSEWKADEIWYVVGAPQQLHFRQIFAVSRRRGITAAMTHVPHGSILGEDRKLMKTRSGDNVQLADVLTEAVERARAAIEEKNATLETAEKEVIAEVVGIGAVKYAELSQHRMTDYVFSWEKMLALQGNTAPYLQYAYVRTRSIFRKLEDAVEFAPDEAFVIEEPAERTMASKLCQFGEIVPEILNDHKPNILTNYLYEVATTFHSFFEACPVLRSEGVTRKTRLALCEGTSRVLRKGLDLLGIQVTERM
jgi:arginyl-tRNA synthetase